MSASRWSVFMDRSLRVLRERTAQIVYMKGADEPSRLPKTLFTFNSRADIDQVATGCDADVGGFSTVHFDLDESKVINASIGKSATGRFWGNMNLNVKPGLEKKIRGGYAGFRNRHRTTIFGEIIDELRHHEYLALRLRVAGDPITHDSYFVNIQSKSPIVTDLWQHRLYFQPHVKGWQDIYIPFTAFVLTNKGKRSDRNITLVDHGLRTVGISILGGNSRVSGKYELGIDSISMVNEEDVKKTLVHSEKEPLRNEPSEKEPESPVKVD